MLTDENFSPSDSLKSKEDLLEEIRLLRGHLADTKEELQSRKAREQTLSGAIKLGFWEWDEIKQCPGYLSEEFARIFGLSQKELYEIYQDEEDLYHFIHPEGLDQYKKHVMKPAKEKNVGGRAHVYDYRIIRPSGEVRHVREMEIGIVENDGVLLHSYGAVQDTTEFHQTLIASQKSEERYGSLFSKLPIGVQEQDWSSIKKLVDKLKSEGIVDIKGYIRVSQP